MKILALILAIFAAIVLWPILILCILCEESQPAYKRFKASYRDRVNRLIGPLIRYEKSKGRWK